MSKKPKVFVCHSSKDKKRFTDDFANKLIETGIRAWYDKYEVKSDDSIVEKVNMGLKETNKCIIVFSKNINESKFMSTEINSIIHDYIYDNKLIIPVIIDQDVEVPKLINHLPYVKINDLNDYTNELNEICDIIFGRKELPKSGEVPTYFELNKLPKCSKQDTDIFKRIGDYCLENSFDAELDYELLNIGKEFVENNYINKGNDNDYIENTIVGTLDTLEENGYIKDCSSNVGLPFTSKCFTSKGFDYYFKNFVEDSDNICKKVVSAIYNDNIFKIDELLNYCDINLNILNALITSFKDKELIICDNKKNILKITSKGDRIFYNLIK